MQRKSILILMLTLAIAFPAASSAAGWEFLFNGKNLNGWKIIGDQEWKVENGAIAVKAAGSEMGWLATEKSYSDFILKMRFQWQGGNSGVQVRSRIDGGKMIGYQANLDPSRPYATGSLLDENGRGMLQETVLSAEKLFKKDQWNEYEISAIGDRITLYVNGIKTAEVFDPAGDKSGIIALQMAPGQGGSMAWDDIRILELPKGADWKSLFNGRDLAQWVKVGDSTWTVEDGCVHGASKNGGYGWLMSRQEYSGFHFSTRFKISNGNSGIQFRSWRVDNMIHGFQADLASGSDWINGHLYDQSEKGVLVKPDQDFSKIIDWKGWNTYEITAIGPKVELFVNGVKSIEHNDPERQKGVFAFQIHAGIVMDTWWDDIRIIPFK
ncbi:MAG: DUF1080 domain-containing protein [Candidatus Omnitrophota bacterium]